MLTLIGALVLAVLDVVALIEVFVSRRPFVEKVLWFLVILMLPLVGLLLYAVLGRGSGRRVFR